MANGIGGTFVCVLDMGCKMAGHAAFYNGKSLPGEELAIARCEASADTAALRGGTKAGFKWAPGSSLAPSTQVRLPEVS